MYGVLCWFLRIFFNDITVYKMQEVHQDATSVDTGEMETEHDTVEAEGEDDNGQQAIEEVDAKRTAPDGGYGWFVVLGCFLSHIIGGGIERADGIYYLQFIARFHQSAQLTSLPGAIMSTLNLCLAPVAGIICNMYSARTSVMIGGFFMSAGCILNGFATNFYFLFFSHALLLGVGRGLSYAPGLILVAMYFDKRRGLATGIGTSGVGIGTFILVPTSQFLFHNYGFQGAFLIIGGIALHTNLAGMLYRPLSMHHLFMRRSKPNIFAVDPVEATEAIITSETTSDLDLGRSLYLNNSVTDQTLDLRSYCSVKNTNSDAEVRVKNPFLGGNIFTTAFKICFPKEIRDTSNKATKKLCHFYLLKNTPFLLYCLSTWVFSMAIKSGYLFLPALVTSKGFSESDASLVMSIAGLADCISRIGAGLLFDLKHCRVYRLFIYTVITISLALVLFLMPSMDSVASFVAICCAFGVFTGVFFSQRVVILVDILGIQHMANSLGIVICFQSIGTLLGPPLSGWVKDQFGTFENAFYVNGVLMGAAGVLMSASCVFFRLQQRTNAL